VILRGDVLLLESDGPALISTFAPLRRTTSAYASLPIGTQGHLSQARVLRSCRPFPPPVTTPVSPASCTLGTSWLTSRSDAG